MVQLEIKAITLDQSFSIHLYGHGKSFGIYTANSSEIYQVDPLFITVEDQGGRKDERGFVVVVKK